MNLDPEEISDHQFNQQIAEEVLGWTYNPATHVWWHQGRQITQLPLFTTSRLDMWRVLDALEARGLTYQITVGSGTAGCSISDRSARVIAGRAGGNDELPRIVGRAALAAVRGLGRADVPG